uniref:Uncharacterized protein n=1 Tax=Anguilla anguilla TaxID=7936 RepID=A0A0E9T587_ANGAN
MITCKLALISQYESEIRRH